MNIAGCSYRYGQPLTTLSAMPLTVREALIVATAASVATITNATAISRKIKSIIPVH